MKQQTRDELLIELAKIKQRHADWISEDTRRREEFAKAFSWVKETNPYNREDEYREPTWPEIFCEIGKLLAGQKALFYVTDIEELKLRIKELEINSKLPKEVK